MQAAPRSLSSLLLCPLEHSTVFIRNNSKPSNAPHLTAVAAAARHCGAQVKIRARCAQTGTFGHTLRAGQANKALGKESSLHGTKG